MIGTALTILLGLVLMRGKTLNRRQTVGEQIYEVAQVQVAEQGLPSKAIGRWFPYVASLLLFIFVVNLIGFIPLPLTGETWHGFPVWGIYAATSSLSVTLALPIFAIAGWPLQGWALAAVLWVASQIFALVLARLPNSPDNLAAAGMRGIGTTSRGLLVGIVLVIVTVSNETVGLAAAILYAIAFTAELGVGLATYFGAETKT